MGDDPSTKKTKKFDWWFWIGTPLTFIVVLVILARALGPEAAIIAFIGLGVFLAIRVLILWYFRINARLDAAEETNALLRELLAVLKSSTK